MVLVSINGVTQIPGIDYIDGEHSVAFLRTPQKGSSILMQSADGRETYFVSDGSTRLFDIGDRESVKIRQMLELAYTYRSVPAVADMLERLQVVVELAQQS